MSHLHFCEVTGHEWRCEGTALRPLAGDTEPSVCMCMPCGIPMEQGDHSKCPVELLMCPEHLAEFQQWVRDNHGEAELLNLFSDADEKIEAALGQLETYEAACLWCGHGYQDYSHKAEDEHFAYHCPDAPDELRYNAKRRLLPGDYEGAEDSAGRWKNRTAMAKQNKQPDAEARVGIFWLYNGKLITDSTPLSEAEPYGDE